MINYQQFSRTFIITAVTITGLFFLIALSTVLNLNQTATAARPEGESPSRMITGTATITPTATISSSNAAFLPLAIQSMPTITPTPTVTPSPTTPPLGCLPDHPPLPPIDAAVEAALAERINQERALHGLPSYQLDEQLVQAARRHAYDMAANNLTWHTGSDGSTYPERIEQACYDAAWSSETIGYGFPSVEAVIGWWLASETHRNTILSAELEEMGVAYVWSEKSDNKHYWVITFAIPAATSDPLSSRYVCTTTITEAEQGISIQWVQDRPCPAH